MNEIPLCRYGPNCAPPFGRTCRFRHSVPGLGSDTSFSKSCAILLKELVDDNCRQRGIPFVPVEHWLLTCQSWLAQKLVEKKIILSYAKLSATLEKECSDMVLFDRGNGEDDINLFAGLPPARTYTGSKWLCTKEVIFVTDKKKGKDGKDGKETASRQQSICLQCSRIPVKTFNHPCHHVLFCTHCATWRRKTQHMCCPICRTEITHFVPLPSTTQKKPDTRLFFFSTTNKEIIH